MTMVTPETKRRTSRSLHSICKDMNLVNTSPQGMRRRRLWAKAISVKKYVVRLSVEEREQLEAVIRKGKSAASGC